MANKPNHKYEILHASRVDVVRYCETCWKWFKHDFQHAWKYFLTRRFCSAICNSRSPDNKARLEKARQARMYVFKPKPKTEKALLREAASARNARRLNAEILKEEMEFQKKLKGGVKWTPENLEYRRKVGLA